ncbi:MAG: EAL domain-containing protein [Ruminiclostridium sp.]|nr:EAL domain-containing protein [Ruminiclostridium sp.]
MDRMAYLDFVALPIFFVLLYATFIRKMTSGTTNRLFILLLAVSAVMTVCDAATALLCTDPPISDAAVTITTVCAGIYHVFHTLTGIIYLLFIMAETRTWYWMTQKHRLVLAFIPYCVLLVLLVVNIFTGCVYTVTPNEGYQRGPLILAFYIIAALYMVWGAVYILLYRKMLSKSRLFSLLMMYIMIGASVLFQMFYPKYLVEMIMTALGELFISLLVLRPEDHLDYSTGMPSFKAYCNDIRKICLNKITEKIIIMRFINASQLRRYLGEEKYLSFVKSIAVRVKDFCTNRGLYFDMYLEQPGSIYLIIDNFDFDFESIVHDLYADIIVDILEVESNGAKVITRFCEIHYPVDTNDADTIFNIGHQFHRIIPYDQFYTKAFDIISSESFRIKNNMDLILNRAIRDRKFEMYYQPIYSIKDGRFVSAEALIRLTDEEYGFVSPALFIPAAERKGLMIPIGDFVLESVFEFISENDFPELGLSYIELNLSVAQCLQGDLADKIFALEKKYHINPERVNLEITETTYENIGEITDLNIKRLSENGFSFSLDDYGTGFSNMHRISRLPLKIIKIDKTMVDDMENKSGMSVLSNTVSMMKDIDKEIVCEGVETKEQLDTLVSLGVDFIQGYYFSKPLSAKQFISFIRERNNVQ